MINCANDSNCGDLLESGQNIEVFKEFLYYTNINSQRPPTGNSQNRQSPSIAISRHLGNTCAWVCFQMQSLTIKTLLLDTTFFFRNSHSCSAYLAPWDLQYAKIDNPTGLRNNLLTNVLIRHPCFPYFVLFDPFVIDPSIQLWPSSLDSRLRKIMLMLQLIWPKRGYLMCYW